MKFRISQAHRIASFPLFIAATLVPLSVLATPDSARVAGDLKVGGIHFSSDNSVQTKASPWGYGAVNGADIGFMQGKVGLGTLTPSEQLELTGNLKLPVTSATSGQIRQGSYKLLHTYGANNLFVGFESGNLATTGNDNTATGTVSLQFNTSGINNTASGSFSLGSNTTGSNNIALGYAAGYYNTVGNNNILIGNWGASAESGIIRIGTPGIHTTTYLTGNVGFGATAPLEQLELTGNLKLPATTAISGQIRQGNYALLHSFGTGNIFVGAAAGNLTTTGSYNTANGNFSLFNNTTGSNNTASGEESLNANTSGTSNTATGTLSLAINTIGNNNIALGYGAGFYTTGNDNILIGNWGVDGETGIIHIGTPSTHNTTYLAGNVSVEPTKSLNFEANIRQMINLWGTTYGIGVQDFTFYTRTGRDFAWFRDGAHNNNPGNPGGGTTLMTLNSPGNLWIAGTLTQASDQRLKTNIQPLENSLDKLLRLRGVSYVMKADETKERKIGVIAQELEQEYPELVATDDQGMKSVAYANLTPVLIEAVKALKAENDALKARLERLEKLLALTSPSP